MEKINNNGYDSIYTVQDIQAILGFGKNKTYQICTSGIFIYKRVGKSIIIPKIPFLAWLNSGDTE